MNLKTKFLNSKMEVNTFEELNLKQDLLKGIFGYGFEKPSVIQQKAILPIIQGKDVIAQAQSGSGKTAVFSISSLQLIDESLKQCQVLILGPTRELANQINTVVKAVGSNMNVNTSVCIGGSYLNKQELSNAQIVIGTPGRVYDVINSGVLKVDHLKLFILDEADEMLSSGFKEQIYEIYQLIDNNNLQNAILSATLSKDILDVAENFMKDPIKILVKNDELTLEGIKQFYVNVDKEDWKLDTLCDLFDAISAAQSIIFVESKRKADWLNEMMTERDFTVSCLHGDLEQKERERVLGEFRSGTSRVLIATDVIARGIDIQQVSLVINYDIPRKVETYIHKVGRSGRFGRKGLAINFVTTDTIELQKNIEKYYSTKIEEMPQNISDYF
jgi:translation initiation factor 4A